MPNQKKKSAETMGEGGGRDMPNQKKTKTNLQRLWVRGGQRHAKPKKTKK